jgi:hypothetical protein
LDSGIEGSPVTKIINQALKNLVEQDTKKQLQS